MAPAPEPDVGRGRSPAVCSSSSLLFTNSLSPLNSPSVGDLGIWPVQFLPEKNSDAKQASESQHPQALTDSTNSLSLCLSALIGLGLCGSAHWVKKLSFGFIPEWYHDGGPFQIGHSHAAMPGSLCPVPVCCFIQPACVVEDLIPQYRLGTVVSLWRKSQFTSTVLAPRAPPVLS
jgi:hypothetical protein